MSNMTFPPDISHAGWLKNASTRAVFGALTAEGHSARAVGGTVRDTLLGLAVSDIDIATTAEPDDVIRLARAAGLSLVPTGLAHGTVTLIVDHTPFEVTTLRTDVETFGRHARVAYSTDWVGDAQRRDFTINAIYADPDGTIFDPLGGRDDLALGRVRFIGDPVARIREDYLRILRFFRFHARFGRGPLDREGLAACLHERAGIAGLSGERLQSELLKILELPRFADTVLAMYEGGLLTRIMGLVAMPDPYARLRAIEAGLDLAPDPVRGLAVLSVRVREQAHHLVARLRLANAQKSRLESMTTERGAIVPDAGQDCHKCHLYRLGVDRWRDVVLYNWALSGDSSDDASWRALFHLPRDWELPRFPVDGGDLLDIGLATGPRIGQILARLEKDWIADRFAATREDLLAQARKLAASAAEAGN